jgi:hypothetical protein
MGKYARGKFIPKNPEKYMGNKLPTYRSSWEATFMSFCDENSNILKWASESIKIPYRNPLTGKQTIYVPDFFVVSISKTGKQAVDLIEVKPNNQAKLESLGKNKVNQLHFAVNQAKWQAARSWCKQRNIGFKVITEDDIYHQGKKR